MPNLQARSHGFEIFLRQGRFSNQAHKLSIFLFVYSKYKCKMHKGYWNEGTKLLSEQGRPPPSYAPANLAKRIGSRIVTEAYQSHYVANSGAICSLMCLINGREGEREGIGK